MRYNAISPPTRGNEMTKTKKQYGWHFTNTTLRDGRPVPEEGVWLEHEGPIKMCETGLHGSHTPFDALQFAPGATLCYCEFEGIEQEDNEKFVARRRKIIAKGDSTEALRFFARMQAVSVIDNYPNGTDDVVFDYLMDGCSADSAYSAADSAADSADSAADSAYLAAASAAAAACAAYSAAGSAARSAYLAADSAYLAAASAAAKYFNDLIYECFEDVLEGEK
jgi:hypothetical protein